MTALLPLAWCPKQRDSLFHTLFRKCDELLWKWALLKHRTTINNEQTYQQTERKTIHTGTSVATTKIGSNTSKLRLIGPPLFGTHSLWESCHLHRHLWNRCRLWKRTELAPGQENADTLEPMLRRKETGSIPWMFPRWRQGGVWTSWREREIKKEWSTCNTNLTMTLPVFKCAELQIQV